LEIEMAASAREEVRGLTSLRGVAALLVLLFHGPILGLGSRLYALTWFFAQGWLWVDFFFLLSGFIMAYAYGPRFAKRFSTRDVGLFLIKRFARIWPLHVLTLAILVGLEFVKYSWAYDYSDRVSPPFTEHSDAAALPLQLAFLQILVPMDTWNTPAWSIGCEWWAYCSFPAIYYAISRLRHPGSRALVYGVCYAALILLWIQSGSTLNVEYNGRGLIRCFAEFILGIGIFDLWRVGAVREWVETDGFFVNVTMALGVALHFFFWDFLVVPLMAALVLATASNRGHVCWLLERWPLRFLGEISFSIYLVHWPVFLAFALLVARVHGSVLTETPSLAVSLALMVVALPLVLWLAHLTYRHVEVPMRHWLTTRLTRLLERAPVAPAPAPPVTSVPARDRESSAVTGAY
jgi:peptidoglycan/LPS O-acetylase OafA/YrhL